MQFLTPVFGAPGDFIVTVGEVALQIYNPTQTLTLTPNPDPSQVALEMFFVDMGVVEV